MGMSNSSMLKVGNCPQCGKVFQKNLRNMCNDCTQMIDNDYRTCYSYLSKNRKCNIEELSAATGVTTTRILEFILDKRLLISDYPNLTYPCDLCGAQIRHNKLCLNCASKITNEVLSMKDADAKAKARQSESNGYKKNIDNRW